MYIQSALEALQGYLQRFLGAGRGEGFFRRTLSEKSLKTIKEDVPAIQDPEGHCHCQSPCEPHISAVTL